MIYVCCLLTRDWPNNVKDHPGIGACVDRTRKPVPGLGERYVHVMQRMIAEHAPEARFKCFTDRPMIPGVPTVYVERTEGYCTEKLQLFRPNMFPAGARVLYVDLDTAIVGDLAPLLSVPLDLPVFLNDKGPRGKWADRIGAGLFSFEAGRHDEVWRQFNAAPTDEAHFAQCFKREEWRSWDDAAPGAVRSFKWDVSKRKDWRTASLGDARVVVFYGDPRPHRVNAPWNAHWDPSLS
jgi:hypothetical protein